MIFEDFAVDMTRTLHFKYKDNKLSYRPVDPYIRTVTIGVRPKDDEDNWIAYMECRIWNMNRQSEKEFWAYAYAYEKNEEVKPFAAVCNFVRKGGFAAERGILKKNNMTGWGVFLSEFEFYDDVVEPTKVVEMKKAVLSVIPEIIKFGFLVEPSYVFVHASEQEERQLKEFGYIPACRHKTAILYGKSCKA